MENNSTVIESPFVNPEDYRLKLVERYGNNYWPKGHPYSLLFKKKFPKGVSVEDFFNSDVASKEEGLAFDLYLRHSHNIYFSDKICDIFVTHRHRWNLIEAASNIHCTTEQADRLCEVLLEVGQDYDLKEASEKTRCSSEMKERLLEYANRTHSREFEIEGTIDQCLIRTWGKEGTSKLQVITLKINDERIDSTGRTNGKGEKEFTCPMDIFSILISHVGKSLSLKVCQTIWFRHDFDCCYGGWRIVEILGEEIRIKN